MCPPKAMDFKSSPLKKKICRPGKNIAEITFFWTLMKINENSKTSIKYILKI